MLSNRHRSQGQLGHASWKLIARTRVTTSGVASSTKIKNFLSNVIENPRKTRNLAEQHPEIADQLRRQHAEHLR